MLFYIILGEINNVFEYSNFSGIYLILYMDILPFLELGLKQSFFLITKTYLCNKLHFFTAVEMIIFR